MSCTFTHHHYKEILDLFKDLGYKTVSFRSFQQDKPFQLILRHDLDIITSNHLQLTSIEHEMGFQSINYFLLTSEIYNLFSQAVYNVIQTLKKQNHFFGVHVDLATTLYWTDPLEYIQYLLKHAETILGSIDSYSFHRPGQNKTYSDFLPNKIPFNVPICTYDQKYFTQIKYISDSKREWKDGCICNHIKNLNGNSIQLLIHTDWWTEKTITRDQVFLQNINEFKEYYKAYLHKNTTFYKKNKKELYSFFEATGDFHDNT